MSFGRGKNDKKLDNDNIVLSADGIEQQQTPIQDLSEDEDSAQIFEDTHNQDVVIEDSIVREKTRP